MVHQPLQLSNISKTQPFIVSPLTRSTLLNLLTASALSLTLPTDNFSCSAHCPGLLLLPSQHHWDAILPLSVLDDIPGSCFSNLSPWLLKPACFLLSLSVPLFHFPTLASCVHLDPAWTAPRPSIQGSPWPSLHLFFLFFYVPAHNLHSYFTATLCYPRVLLCPFSLVAS